MRAIVITVACCLSGAAAGHGQEKAFPYPAQIASDEVEVRCGPGWDYYPTLRLKRGETVEVHRHEPGGWLAIRPPQGSHSWVTARQLKLTDEPRVAEVVVDGAVAWVGAVDSHVGQLKWQVRLQRGELLEVLGERSLSVGPGFATETYCQVAPPAGEYRWIHAEHAASPEAVAHRAAAQTITLTEYASPARPTQRVVPESGDGRTPTRPTSDLAREVDQLQTDLSLVVAESIDRWDLNALKERADQLSAAASGTPWAREVRTLSQRIVEFETVRRRHERSRESGSGSATAEDERVRRNQVPREPRRLDGAGSRDDAWGDDADEAVGSGVTQASAQSPVAESLLEAEGWLMPVHSTKRVAPPFALLDDDGRVQCYVTPVPGLNLRRYAKTYIGLQGERRHVESLRATHITAERIVKLSRSENAIR